MKTLEWTTIDKKDWGPGDWSDEPDKVQWPDAVTGLPCLAVRNPHGGNWCGYVGVVEGHPWHRQDCNDVKTADGDYVDAHGGLTFSGACAETADPSKHICHVPDEGEPDGVWWLGFDCAHAWDISPASIASVRKNDLSGFWAPGPDEIYRTLAYVKQECAGLARQADAVASGSEEG